MILGLSVMEDCESLIKNKFNRRINMTILIVLFDLFWIYFLFDSNNIFHFHIICLEIVGLP